MPVYATLDALGITYDKYAHPPVFTGEDAAEHWAAIDGTKVKNLFLRNKKGDRHYLVILEVSKQADLRQLVKIVGDDRLSFGSPERLMATLGITPGSVSPFGSDPRRRPARAGGDRRGPAGRDRVSSFIPTSTRPASPISGADLERFLASRGNVVTWVRLA